MVAEHLEEVTLSKRASTSSRRIIYERKSTSRKSDQKYARGGRNEESSRITSRRILSTKNCQYKKLTESHDMIQRLTSQIQKLQERMNCLSDSGEFQEVESNYSFKSSHVPSQPAVIPSPSSMPSCDKRLPFDTWNLTGSQENVFVNPRSGFHQVLQHRCGSSACLYRDTCCKR